jgi:hypothetical protein
MNYNDLPVSYYGLLLKKGIARDAASLLVLVVRVLQNVHL